jgi:hypothetical protein
VLVENTNKGITNGILCVLVENTNNGITDRIPCVLVENTNKGIKEPILLETKNPLNFRGFFCFKLGQSVQNLMELEAAHNL